MKIPTSDKAIETVEFERVHIPEDIYPAMLLEVKDISEGKYGERVAFIYEIKVSEDKKVELAHVCYKPDKATPGNKFGQTLLSHGVDLSKGETDTDEILNTGVRVMVEDYDYKPDESKPEVKKASGISKVKPLEIQ